MNLNYITETAMQKLKRFIRNSSLEELTDIYICNNKWLDDFFESNNWYRESRIHAEKFSLKKSEEHSLFDLTNTRLLYNALVNLKPYQAIEERLWCYLTHVDCWEYMRSRWPIEDGNYKHNEESIKRWIFNRYFFTSKSRRSIRRNGVSRLWWYGYMTYEQNSANPFKHTEILLERQDIAVTLFARNFSNNSKILKSILTALRIYKENNGELPKRKIIRDLAKQIEYLGGVLVLDELSKEELIYRCNQEIKRLT